MTLTKLQKLGFIAVVLLFELLFYVFYSGSNMVIAVLPQDFEVRLLPYFFVNLTMFLSFFAIFLKFTGTKIFLWENVCCRSGGISGKMRFGRYFCADKTGGNIQVFYLRYFSYCNDFNFHYSGFNSPSEGF